MTRALVTGITGQDGWYLTDLLLERGTSVVGLTRDRSSAAAVAIRARSPQVELLDGDLANVPRLREVIELSQPDYIYNLAAFSEVGRSWDLPVVTSEVTGLGLLHLLEAVRQVLGESAAGCRIYQASSSEMFGKPDISPQTERTRFHPRSPYGVAKVFAHNMAVNYRESYGMHVSCGILYNHESIRRPPHFVTRKISAAVAAIHLGLQANLRLGNLNVRRDWGHAQDYVKAMWLMLQQDNPDDYIIATGTSHSLRDFLDVAFAHVGLDWQAYVLEDPSLLRPADVDNLVGDAAKAQAVLGWAPTRSFDDIVRELVEADLARLAARPSGWASPPG